MRHGRLNGRHTPPVSHSEANKVQMLSVMRTLTIINNLILTQYVCVYMLLQQLTFTSGGVVQRETECFNSSSQRGVTEEKKQDATAIITEIKCYIDGQISELVE